MDFYDFFSGCGGSSCGMQAAGMTVRFGLDNDPDAAKTFRHNFPESDFLQEDIRELSVDAVRPFLNATRSVPRLFGACAPCQPFSKQNRHKSSADDRRSLLIEFQRFVHEFRPEYIFVENVPGIQNVDKEKGPFTDFLGFLRETGYYCDHRVVMAYHYGVPQSRSRLVLMASSLAPIKIPQPTHGPGTSRPDLPTVREWIKELPDIAAGESHPTVPNHRASSLSLRNLQRIEATPEEGGRHDWPEELQLACHRNHAGHTDVYGRLRWDRPASALTTRCISLSNGRFGHPRQNRAISVREAACLQTFPRDFIFHGSLVAMARQVGNAVPAKMAQIFGSEFLDHYNNLGKKEVA
ncbi:MAG: DNA cytosine methyltransferase [Magnetococcales bacterium]|nr:DNA cytosine methyltransferase [Magnetococcales bacterium]MBF0114645.1 DNA cytosine methyltransferase [Magnetococcales bacterium]